jgi:hypothetical protein
MVPAGAPLEDIELLGNGGSPSVMLTSPSGRQVVPSESDVRAPAYAVPFPAVARTVVVLNHPQAGRWTFAPAVGSAPVRQARAASGLTAPRIRAVVRGTGHQRALRYVVGGLGRGVAVSFAEQAGRVFKVLGAARGRHGLVRFAPADGAAGRRAIVALVSIDGQPRSRAVVARYAAPGPERPGRVQRLRIRRRGGSFTVTFRGVRGAARYLVRLDASDGRHIQQVILASQHRLRVRALGYFDRLRVTVTGLSVSGRSGPTARTRG